MSFLSIFFHFLCGKNGEKMKLFFIKIVEKRRQNNIYGKTWCKINPLHFFVDFFFTAKVLSNFWYQILRRLAGYGKIYTIDRHRSGNHSVHFFGDLLQWKKIHKKCSGLFFLFVFTTNFVLSFFISFFCLLFTIFFQFLP